MLQVLEEKMKNLAQKLEASAANHNGLLGAMQTLRELYSEALTAAPIVEAVDPAVVPIVAAAEGIVDAAEPVAAAVEAVV